MPETLTSLPTYGSSFERISLAGISAERMEDLFLPGENDQRRSSTHAGFNAPIRQGFQDFVKTVHTFAVAYVADHAVRRTNLIPRVAAESYSQHRPDSEQKQGTKFCQPHESSLNGTANQLLLSSHSNSSVIIEL